MKVSSEYVLHNLYFNALIEKGWQLCSGYGGVLTKNGCIFFDHSFTPDERNFVSCVGDEGELLHKPVRVQLNPNKCNWHIESLGWLLKRGYYNDRFAILEDSPELTELKNDFDSEINEIDYVATLSVVERRSLKMKPVNIPKTNMVLKPVPCSNEIEEGSFIRVTKTVDNNPLFVEGACYQIDFVTDRVVILRVINKRYKLTDKSYQSDVIEFLRFIQDGTVECIEIKEVQETTYTKEWTSLGIGASSDILPKQLKDCKATDTRKMMIATAYVQCQNFTPYLNTGLKDVSCENITQLIELNYDNVGLAYGSIGSAVCKKIVELSLDGYDISNVPVDGVIYSDLCELIDEEFEALKEFDKLTAESFSLDQIRMLKRVNFFKERDPDLINSSYTPSVIKMLSYLKKYKCSKSVSKYLAAQMLGDKEPYVSKMFCTVEVITFMRLFLKTDRDLYFLDTSWNDFIEKVLEGSYYISFSEKRGLLLSNGTIEIGRDFNSYVVYERGGRPLWRAVLINGGFIVNRSKENEIII